MTNSKLLLLLLLPLLSQKLAIASNDECPIDCANGSRCVKGGATFTAHPVQADIGYPFAFHMELERDGWHCDCPPGYTGLECKHPFEVCNDGDHICYNGGNCIHSLEEQYAKEQQFCDCQFITDEFGHIRRYSGKYCEIEVIASGNRCEANDRDNANPCLNDGICKKTVGELEICECKTGYVGRVCEFFQPSVPECSLECQHGGVCRYGSKSEDQSLVLEDMATSVVAVHKDYMTCDCPMGFSGVLCETQEEICGDIKCLHGSSCISINDTESGDTIHHCDCVELNKQILERGGDIQFSGRHCEIQSSFLCYYNNEVRPGTFCAHDGACPIEWYEDCTCTEGYYGSYCEFQGEDTNQACSLECVNGGQCRKGSTPSSGSQVLAARASAPLQSAPYSQDFEHCACPDGFVGLQCQYTKQNCGNGSCNGAFVAASSKGEPSKQTKLGALGGTRVGIPLIILFCVCLIGIGSVACTTKNSNFNSRKCPSDLEGQSQPGPQTRKDPSTTEVGTQVLQCQPIEANKGDGGIDVDVEVEVVLNGEDK